MRRRYSGFGIPLPTGVRSEPTLSPTVVASAAVGPASLAPAVAVPALAPIVASWTPNLPIFSIGPQAGPRPILADPRTAASFGPVQSTVIVPPKPTGQQEVVPGDTGAVHYPSGGGGGGGGYDFSRKAWDQQPEEVVEVPLPDGTTALVVQHKPSVLTIAAAAGGGFLLGGPVGALVGAAVGYFATKKPKRMSASISFYRR